MHPRRPSAARAAWSSVLLASGALAALGLVGCATTLKPVYPSSAIQPAQQTQNVRFSPDQVVIEEPGVRMSTGNLWKRDVANFTADRLNTMVGAREKAPVIQTRVTFAMQGPQGFQMGSWKEMTVGVSSLLPDGRMVQSAPQSAYIDNNFEYLASQVLLFGGPVFEVAAFTLGMVLFSAGIANAYNGAFCACILALAFAGLFLNVAQAFSQWIIGLLEERRASDLYQEVLQAHAADVQRVLAGGALPTPDTTWKTPAGLQEFPLGDLPTPTDEPPRDAPDGLGPPPMLDDPADDPSPSPPEPPDPAPPPPSRSGESPSSGQLRHPDQHRY